MEQLKKCAFCGIVIGCFSIHGTYEVCIGCMNKPCPLRENKDMTYIEGICMACLILIAPENIKINEKKFN